MKVFDATAVIAFLNEMDCPDGMVKLAKHHKIIIPRGVASEIKKSPGKEMLESLTNRGIVKITDVAEARVEQIQSDYPQLHRGECEAIAFMQMHYKDESACIVSDDSKARKVFHILNHHEF